MATYTITTTDAEETALSYAYQLSQQPVLPQNIVAYPNETQAAFLQRQVSQSVLAVMQADYARAVTSQTMASIATIPPDQRDAAVAEIATVIDSHGGTVIDGPLGPSLTARRKD